MLQSECHSLGANVKLEKNVLTGVFRLLFRTCFPAYLSLQANYAQSSSLFKFEVQTELFKLLLLLKT